VGDATVLPQESPPAGVGWRVAVCRRATIDKHENLHNGGICRNEHPDTFGGPHGEAQAGAQERGGGRGGSAMVRCCRNGTPPPEFARRLIVAVELVDSAKL